MTRELEFHSMEELKDYLKIAPDDVIIKITVEEEGEEDGQTE